MPKRKIATATIKNRVIVYMRYSSDNQSYSSIEAQERETGKYCKDKGYIIVNSYIDTAKSATTDDRPAFQQMISDVKEGNVTCDYVLVHKLDRFARSTYDSIYYEAQLNKYGIAILSVVENLDGSIDSKFMKTVYMAMAELYSQNLGREVMKGLKTNALKGKHTGGFPPLGFNVNDEKYYEINEEEAVIVYKIFEMYTSGYGYKQILKYLNSMGYKTKFGNAFGNNSLHTILSNVKYAGIMVYNLRLEKGLDGKRRPALKPEEEVIRAEGVIPQIIPTDMFDKAQVMLERNAINGGRFKAKIPYLLSGLGYCGECGASLYGNSRHSGRGKTLYVTYRCSARAQHKGCNTKEMNRKYLDEFVLSELYDRLFNDSSIQSLSQMLTNYNEQMNTTNKHELDTATVQLKSIDTELNNLLELVSTGAESVAFKTIQKKLNELEERREYLQSYIKELTNNATLQISTEMIAELVEKSKSIILEKSIAEAKMFIDSYLEKVLLFNDHVEVYFKIHVPNADGQLVSLVSSVENKVLLRDYKEAR